MNNLKDDEKKLILHMAEGGLIKNTASGQVTRIKHITVVGGKNLSIEQILEEYEIHLDPKDLEILELRETVARQNEVIQRYAKGEAAKKEVTKMRKRPVFLNEQDIQEIKAQLEANPKIQNQELAAKFGVSSSMIGKLLHNLGLRTMRKYVRKAP